MKIAYIINSLDGGGGALPLPHVIEVMRQAGHQVFVVALMKRDGRARPLLESACIPHTVIGGAKRKYLETSIRLDRIIRRERPDIIWTSLTHATIAGQIAGLMHRIPVVSWMHNAWLKPINQKILRRTHRLTRHWVADSQTVADFGMSALGVPADRISIWPLFRAETVPPSRVHEPNRPFRLGSLGRLHVNKGYDVLVQALAHLKDARPDLSARFSVHIAGEGRQREALEAQCRALGVDNLHLDGFTDDPAAFLAGLDGYVQPSHHEGLCIAAHEAMLAGLPIIASPVGEMARSIQASRGGQLAPYGDAVSLADAIAALIEDRAESISTGLRAQQWVTRQYSCESFRTRGLQALAAAGII